MTKTINCIILDDELHAVQLLKDYALKIPFLNLIYAGSDPFVVIDLLRNNDVDIVFLDIMMPQLTGIEIMEQFKLSKNFIITSAYQEYALDSYNFNVIDYLLKPITFKRFYQSIEKFHAKNDSGLLSSQKKSLLVKADRRFYNIKFNTIIYIEGMRDYVKIHTFEKVIITYEKIKDMELKLPAKDFIRIHKSYIVAKSEINMIEGNRVHMSKGNCLPIGETYRKEFFGNLT